MDTGKQLVNRVSLTVAETDEWAQEHREGSQHSQQCARETARSGRDELAASNTPERLGAKEGVLDGLTARRTRCYFGEAAIGSGGDTDRVRGRRWIRSCNCKCSRTQH